MTLFVSKNLPKSQNNKQTAKRSIPAFTVGIDPTPFDFVPDADTPEKLMKLYERKKEVKNETQNYK